MASLFPSLSSASAAEPAGPALDARLFVPLLPDRDPRVLETLQALQGARELQALRAVVHGNQPLDGLVSYLAQTSGLAGHAPALERFGGNGVCGKAEAKAALKAQLDALDVAVGVESLFSMADSIRMLINAVVRAVAEIRRWTRILMGRNKVKDPVVAITAVPYHQLMKLLQALRGAPHIADDIARLAAPSDDAGVAEIAKRIASAMAPLQGMGLSFDPSQREVVVGALPDTLKASLKELGYADSGLASICREADAAVSGMAQYDRKLTADVDALAKRLQALRADTGADKDARHAAIAGVAMQYDALHAITTRFAKAVRLVEDQLEVLDKHYEKK